MRVVFTRIDNQLPLFVESIGYDWLQKSVVRPKGYPYYHWLQTNSGQGVITLNNQHFLLPQGSGLLLIPHTPHQYQPVSDEPWITEYLTFSGREVEHLIPRSTVNYQIFNHIDANLNQLFRGKITVNSDPVELSVLVYRFLLYLNKNVQQLQTSPNTRSLAIVREYLEQNFQQQISNDELAELVGFSVQHLIRLFKVLYGMTPLQYLNDLRLRNAKAFLTSQSEWSVNQIALRSGFLSASYFTAKFRSATGLTPKEFRQLH